MLLAVVVPTVMAAEPGPELKLLDTLEKGRPNVLSPVVFSPDGKLLAACEGNRDEGEAAIKLWDVDKRKVIATLTKENHDVSTVAFSPDGKTLATDSHDRHSDDASVAVTLWDVPGVKVNIQADVGSGDRSLP